MPRSKNRKLKTRTITVRLTYATHKAMLGFSRADGCSHAETIRKMIEHEVMWRKAMVDVPEIAVVAE